MKTYCTPTVTELSHAVEPTSGIIPFLAGTSVAVATPHPMLSATAKTFDDKYYHDSMHVEAIEKIN